MGFSILAVILIYVIVVFSIGAIVSKARGARPKVLVLKEVSIDHEGPVYVRIVARRPGVVAWLFTLCGISPIVTCEIFDNRMEYTEGSMSGTIKHTIPLRTICNIGTGYVKLIFLLIGGLAMVAVAIVLPFVMRMGGAISIGLLFVAAIWILIYHLCKRFGLFILPPSSIGFSITVERSVIEGVALKEELAYEMVDLVTDLVARSRQKA